MRNGQVIQVDTPQELILNPKTQFVKDFIGERKSPWQTAVDVIADQSRKHVITKEMYEKGAYSQKEMYIITDENNMYMGAVREGSLIETTFLPNDMPLFKATEVIQSVDQGLFPVIKEKKLVGVISYQEIVAFLKSKTRLENGVVQS